MNSNKKTARDASYFQTSGALLLGAKDWAGIVEQFPYGLGALIFYFTLFQSELIPRWLSGWGLVGATLILAMGLLRMFGHPVVYLAIPIIMFPILKEQSEILALGYVGARIFEGFFDALIAISMLLLLPLSREFV